MENGYKIYWTEHALYELADIIDHLERRWTEEELLNFSLELDHTVELISKNPALFPFSDDRKKVRRAVVLRHNSLYYRRKGKLIEILSLFLNHKDPDKRKLE